MEKNSTLHKPSSFINRLAWIAFAISLTALLAWTVSFLYAYGGPRIVTMRAVRLVHLSGMIFGTVLGLASVLILVVRRQFYSADMARAFLAVLLGILGIRAVTGFWHTTFGRVEAASRAVCGTNLKSIDTAMYHYSQVHEGKYPPQDNWQQTLIKAGYFRKTGTQPFICPSAGGDSEKECSYIYREPASSGTPASWIVLHDRKNNHSLRPFGRNVLMGHGAQFVTEEEFQELIHKENAERKQLGLPSIPADD